MAKKEREAHFVSYIPSYPSFDNLSGQFMICSNCGYGVCSNCGHGRGVIGKPHYCPNCGTKMELKPCEDCISRKDAVRIASINSMPVDECVKMIKALPSVTPQQTRWIPCSERMPEVSDHYLIQYSRHVCPDEMAVAFYSVEEAEVDENYTWEFKPYADCKEVIAWMPLPQPYRGEEE